MNHLMRVITGMIVMTCIIMLYPIADALTTFFSICLMPIIFLVAMGVVSDSTYQLIRQGLGFEWYRQLKERIAVYRETMDEKPPCLQVPPEE